MFQRSAPYPQWHSYLPAFHLHSGKSTCVPCRFRLRSSVRHSRCLEPLLNDMAIEISIQPCSCGRHAKLADARGCDHLAAIWHSLEGSRCPSPHGLGDHANYQLNHSGWAASVHITKESGGWVSRATNPERGCKTLEHFLSDLLHLVSTYGRKLSP